MPTNQYYPTLSTVISLNDLPDYLGFIKEGIQSIFADIYIKDLQTSISPRGESGFYGLSIVSRKRLQFEIPGTGIFFILNPDSNDVDISSFPVTVEYQWLVLQFVNNFNLDNFSFSAEDLYKLGLEILNISEEQVIQTAINNFVEPVDEAITSLEQFISDVNTGLGLNIQIPQTGNRFRELVISIKEQSGNNASLAVLGLYFIENGNPLNSLEKVKDFFRYLIPDDIDGYIKQIITPTARVTLALTAAIEFPRSILKPVNPNGTPYLPNTTKTRFQFAQALLYADTQLGVGFQLELGGSLNPEYAEIGNTGIILQIESLKLDLSKKTNIAEADADGRPADFTGVYARAIAVTLPARWFQDEAVQGTPATSLRLGAYDFLIGTGGLSGTIMLETVSSVITGGPIYYFEDKFNIQFPIIIFEKDQQTNVIKEVTINDLVTLKSKLFPSGSSVIPPNPIKFPIKLTEILPLTGGEKTFNDIKSYQEYLNSFQDADINSSFLWKKIGSADNGFKIGFKSFDITFKQDKVISSNISGKLEIKKFVYPGTNTPVNIDITGHLSDDGDFNLTASAQPPYPIELKDVFTYQLKTVGLGKQDDDFYIGTSGTLQFDGFLKEVLGLGPIEIDALRIYSSGHIEFEGGGTLNLKKPIKLPIGPVDINVTALHYGSMQKEVGGEMRNFYYFGFDGGLTVNPFGIEVRGDGVKYYFCLEEPSLNYLHIQTLYLDLIIPKDTPTTTIKGWLSIPDPGVSKEYAGGLDLKIQALKVSGSVNMKLSPRYPAFIIDASFEFPAPIPMGSFALYGLRGLMGYRYVADKKAVGLTEEDTWFDYYKVLPRGIQVQKFSGPDQTAGMGTPFSIGAGGSFGTSSDNGTTFNLNVMLLLSIPSVFMLDGKANVISKRLGLESTKEPPFFAMAAIGPNSIEMGFGADFKMPTSSGALLKLFAEMQAAFYFNDMSKWFVHFGTKEKPTTATILSLVEIKSYLMLSAKGIELGARGDFDFKRTYAGIIKVHAWAYIGVGGKVSFERPQFGAYLEAGIGAEIDVKFVSLHASLSVLFAVEAVKPFLIYGKAQLKIRIRILFVFKFSFNKEVEIIWEKSKQVDRTPLTPLINSTNTDAIPQLVKGVNMLSNETFELAYLGGQIPTDLDEDILKTIIPLDTYIDIKTEKGLIATAVSNLIGGITNAPTSYTDLVPPDKVVKGKELRQVKHKYSVESIIIKSWSPTENEWVDYHPYKAIYPDDNSEWYNSLKIGQFQKSDGVYNTIRLLATTPFSYTEQGEPGWYIPEQYGLTPGTLFCASEELGLHCADFLQKPLSQIYYSADANQAFLSNNAAFLITQREEGDYAEVTNDPNVFIYPQSLAFNNTNVLQITLPQPSVKVILKITNGGMGVRIKYYSALFDDIALEAQYGNPDIATADIYEPFTVVLTSGQLQQPVEYYHPAWRPVTRIDIEPITNEALINNLTEQVAAITNNNEQIALGIISGEIQSTTALETQLANLNNGLGEVQNQLYSYSPLLSSYRIAGQNGDFTAWDADNSTRVLENGVGFFTDINANNLIVHSASPILSIKFLPVSPAKGSVLISGTKASIRFNDIQDFINPQTGLINILITHLNQQNITTLCNLYDALLEIYDSCFVNPASQPTDFAGLANCASDFQTLLIDFDANNSEYLLIASNDILINAIAAFKAQQDLGSYEVMYRAVYNFLINIGESASCHSGTAYENEYEYGYEYEVSPCSLYESLTTIANNLGLPSFATPEDLGNYAIGLTEFMTTIRNCFSNYPDVLAEVEGMIDEQLFYIDIFLADPYDYTYFKSYFNAYAAVQSILNILNSHYDCNCGCATDTTLCPLYADLDKILTALQEPVLLSEITEAQTNAINLFLDNIIMFDQQNADYYLGYLFENQITLINQFVTNPTIANYQLAYAALDSIVSNLLSIANCNCSCSSLVSGEESEMCNLYNQLNLIVAMLVAPGENPDIYVVRDLIVRYIDTIQASGQFEELQEQYPEYFEIFEQFIYTVYTGDDGFYGQAYNAACLLAGLIKINANCGCDTDTILETLYDSISDILNNGALHDADQFTDISAVITDVQEIYDFIVDLTQQYPGYNIWEGLADEFAILNDFLTSPDPYMYDDLIAAIEDILEYINAIGDYTFTVPKGRTLFHEVCWLSLESYEYNAAIPGIEAISEDSRATIAGITTYVQPVWRPDTSYTINFVLRDTVDNGITVQDYPYTYGFTTAGPVGYFHKHQHSNYGDKVIKANEVIPVAANLQTPAITGVTVPEISILNDVKGELRYAQSGQLYPANVNALMTPHPDNYPLTSLKQYIDYNRSYPYADGNLLSAKPLFYNDDTSQIYLFFTKSYVTHFFAQWYDYNGIYRSGRMKVVIKDPVEGVEIVNPPYLDFNENDITVTNIPQTVEVWQDDENPVVPFVISQWANLYNNNNCVIVGADVIKPASKYISIALKYLKPNKLYTAIVNNLYDQDGDGAYTLLSETTEVHKFVFKTSRYADFNEQVNSYQMQHSIGDTLFTQNAVFTVSKALTPAQTEQAYKTITGQPNTADALILRYQHAYDRIFEGVLGFEAWHEPATTEFNIIRNENDNTVAAIIIRCPEPFNIPRILVADVQDTICVMSDSEHQNADYSTLHSKDYSQAIIMSGTGAITDTVLTVRFRFKIWNGNAYDHQDEFVTIQLT